MIAFIDESSVMMQPTVRRTWAPRGQTPVLPVPSSHGRASVIGAITFTPVRGKTDFLFELHAEHICGEDVAAFLAELRRELNYRPLLVVLDNASTHRKGIRLLRERYGDAIRPLWLPPYAPELNPIEQLWGHVKYGRLPNWIPSDVEDLFETLQETMSELDLELLPSFIAHAGLLC